MSFQEWFWKRSWRVLDWTGEVNQNFGLSRKEGGPFGISKIQIGLWSVGLKNGGVAGTVDTMARTDDNLFKKYLLI